MLAFRDQGRTILFVSHNLSAVEMMCQRAVWLDHGEVRRAGPTAEVVKTYLDTVDAGLLRDAAASLGAAPRSAGGPEAALEVEAVRLFDGDGRLREDFGYGDPLRVHLRCHAVREVNEVRCVITVRGDYGPLFAARSQLYPRWQPGVHELDCEFAELPLLPGLYRVDVQIQGADTPKTVPHRVAAFRVVTDLKAFGSDSRVGLTKSRGGFLAVGYDWRVQSAAGTQALPGLRTPRKMVASGRP
jgi:hypothetical protein